MNKLIYPELSYKLVGILFEVYNNLGYGYQEKYYQKALEQEFIKNNIKYIKESFYNIKYKQTSIGKYFIDFLVEGKIVLELKVANNLYKRHLSQVLGYLKSHNLKLGILAIFTEKGLMFERVLNSNYKQN